jgi:hypothetical protein
MSDQPRDPGLEVTHLRGWVARLIRASVLGVMPTERLEEFLEALPESARTFAEQPPEVEDWVPTALLAAFLSEARSRATVPTERSRARMEADHFMSLHAGPTLATPEDLVAHLPQLYAEVHRGGRLVVVELRRGGARLALSASYPYGSWYSEVLPMWMERALTLSGAVSVRVVHHPPRAGDPPWQHGYQADWT